MTPDMYLSLLLLLATAAIATAVLGLVREFPEEGIWRPAGITSAVVLIALTIAAMTDANALRTTVFVAVAAIATAIAIVDVRRLLVPDILVLALAIVAVAAPDSLTPASQLAGLLALTTLFLLVRWAHFWRRGSEGLGLGDVKLAAASGLLLGPVVALQTTAGAAAIAIAWSLCGPAQRRTPAPFGAALAAGIVVALAVSSGRHA